MEITSLENQLVKKVASLHQKKYRDQYKEFFIEGVKAIKEAIEYKVDISCILYSSEIIDYNFDVPTYKVTKEIMDKITDTSTPQGIVAVCKMPKGEIIKREKLVYLDRVQDPGNVGTIIRTADAFKFDGVLLSKGCADVYSPKVVRSTMGSLFHLPICQDVDLDTLKSLNSKIYSSTLDTRNFINDIVVKTPLVLVIGNEGQGISDDVKNITDEFVKINMEGNAESLNASIAAGILMYEISTKSK